MASPVMRQQQKINCIHHLLNPNYALSLMLGFKNHSQQVTTMVMSHYSVNFQEYYNVRIILLILKLAMGSIADSVSQSIKKGLS